MRMSALARAPARLAKRVSVPPWRRQSIAETRQIMNIGCCLNDKARVRSMSSATSHSSKESPRTKDMLLRPPKLCSRRPKGTQWPSDRSFTKRRNSWLLVWTVRGPSRPGTRTAPPTRLLAASSKPLYLHVWTWSWEQYSIRWDTKSVPSTSMCKKSQLGT